MVYAITSNIPTAFTGMLNNVDIQLEPFNLNRCDERTLYIPISLKAKGNKVVCDLIYLVDKHEMLGAISLNERYDYARDFFNNHFNYSLLYADEQHLAKIVSQTAQFKQYLKQYATHYPKHITNKTFPM